MEGCVLGIAIEDRVDVFALVGSDEYRFTKNIEEGGDYLAEVYVIIQGAMANLVTKAFRKCARDFFNSIDSLVVSTPGVVDSNRYLLQIPLWHSEMHECARWQHQGAIREEFDFAEVLASIVDEIIAGDNEKWGQRERQRFINRVFVVNDVTACAAFEYQKRRESADIRQLNRKKDGETISPQVADFIYMKIHNGMNVGVVEQQDVHRVNIKTAHAEAGHSFPRLHSADYKAGFKGVCYFHNDCFEGMIAANSWLKRAMIGKNKSFIDWRNYARGIKHSKGSELDRQLVRYIMGTDDIPPAGDGEGIEILAHYVAQAIYNLSIGPSCPKQVILGGRMARTIVIERVRDKLVSFARGYPRRRELSVEGVGEHVIPSLANREERHLIEIRGALAIAFARANRAVAPSSKMSLVDFSWADNTVVPFRKK